MLPRPRAPAPHHRPFLPFINGKRSWGKKNRLKGVLQVGRKKEFWLLRGWEDDRARANKVFAELQTRCCRTPASQHTQPAANVGEISSGSTPAMEITVPPRHGQHGGVKGYGVISPAPRSGSATAPQPSPAAAELPQNNPNSLPTGRRGTRFRRCPAKSAF